MTRHSPPLLHRPAYIGLFASLFLAAVCNTFLDIQYGAFVFETMFWAIVFGITVRIAWRQQGEVSEAGRDARKAVLILGMVLLVVIFIPKWGFPRAGVQLLAMLQAAQNCVTISRRNLHMGLLVSAVMVMFAASHHRADWTMLFYLVPYIAAVVFTLVAEQISRRAQELRRESLSAGSTAGQGVAIVAATTAILLGGALLYGITPQVTWPYLSSKYGQPGNSGFLGEAPGMGQNAEGKPESDKGEVSLPRGRWPSPQEMREAAKRKGMPQWQSSSIRQLADWAEIAEMTLTPIKFGLDELIGDIKEWLREHWREIIQALVALILLALLIASWLLLKEARIGLWLRSRFDYLRLGLLRLHAQGNAGAYQYYRALQRLMDVQGLPREPTTNTREYLALMGHRHEDLRRELIEMTFFFERARYGNSETTSADLNRLRDSYLRIYSRVNA